MVGKKINSNSNLKMSISRQDFEMMQARTHKARGLVPAEQSPPLDLSLINQPERKLHDSLIEFYNQQWPRWKVIYARQDKRSTIPVGCQDHTVFADNSRFFCFELKKKNSKPDAEQLAWHKEMEMLGHVVFVIHNMDEFRAAINLPKQIICHKCGLRKELGENPAGDF